jgi:signal transduction histidine kinase/FixJ family two-component response regulator
MSESAERPASSIRQTPYQLTLSALIVPLRLHLLFNAASGVAFAFVGGPYLALLWVAGLSVGDLILQRLYRRLDAGAADLDSDRGLRQLGWFVLGKAMLWISAPSAYAITTHSPIGLAFVAVISITLTALAASTIRNSQRMFLTLGLAPVAALAVCVVAAIGVRPGFGLLLEIAITAGMLLVIAAGTNRTVADWNLARRQSSEAMAGMKAALARSEAVETELIHARDGAEAANRAKSLFLATMSHEIRTPLNGVLGMAQAMAGDRLDPAQRSRLDTIRQSGETLLAVLNDVLDLSRIEAGRLELEMIDFDVGRFAEDVARAFAGVAAAKSLALVVEVEAAARGRYRGDRGRLRQILSNLVSNALKFTDAGEVRLHIDRHGDVLRFTVCDTGIGIPAERLPGVFEKFQQVDASITRRFGGTGLGLAICRQLAALMGGEVQVSSQEGVGSRFQLSVSLERVGEEATAESGEGAPTAPVNEGPALRVLAAEDNNVNRLVLRTLLEQAGIDPVIVSDGSEAVTAWRERDWDVILMDVQMPVLDGPSATRAIRAAERATGRPRTPIVALTANAMAHQRDEYAAAGMDGFIAKPIQVAQLFDVLQAAVDGALTDADASESAARRVAIIN